MISVEVDEDAAIEIARQVLFDTLKQDYFFRVEGDILSLTKSYEAVLRDITWEGDERLKIFDTIYDKIVDKDV